MYGWRYRNPDLQLRGCEAIRKHVRGRDGADISGIVRSRNRLYIGGRRREFPSGY